MYEACKSDRDHPSVHICEKLPKKGFARKTHRQLKHLLKRLKKREKRRKSHKKKSRKGKQQSRKRKIRGRQSGKGKIRRKQDWTNIVRGRGRGVRLSHVVETLEI